MTLTPTQRADVIRARRLIQDAIDSTEHAEAKLKRAGLSTARLDRAGLHLTEQHVACSEALR